MHKGYKFTPEQLMKRKDSRKKKGKWSRLAKAKHSVRMKERWAAKQESKDVVSTNKLTINERLNSIEHHCKAIKQQLGG